MTSEELVSQLNTSSGNASPSKQGIRNFGFILAGLTGSAAIGLSIVCAPFVAPALRKVCLPYVPATTRQVQNVLQGLRGSSGSLIDLGSGDGRIVIAAAKEGRFRSVGVELNPWLVWYSRWKAWREGVGSSTSFVTKDLWTLHLAQYHNVVIFGVEEMMVDLEAKLDKELSEGGHIVACRFPLPSWKPVTTIGEGIDSVWVYRKETCSLPVWPTSHSVGSHNGAV
ncbi:ATP synthase subunit C lysine N-methyltransferase isoform X2 [Oratosquilla oratoria]|uniref:ATP synthase subunit C lysine N-methyltransferase isoform X2 n=1 Tax=Oratosquilla oratoria TaxID=337810 RepID=UPI003F76231C